MSQDGRSELSFDRTPTALARAGQARLARCADRRAVQSQDARRGRRDPADAARQARARWRASSSRWGASPAAGDRRGGDQPPRRRRCIDRRGGIAHLRRDAPALERARPRACATRASSAGDGVAIMCRNHRCFIEATLAFSKLGANALYMNTAFSGPQLADVIEREEPAALDLRRGVRRAARQASEAGTEIGLQPLRRLERGQGRERDGRPTLDELIESDSDDDLDPPAESGRFVILTSGTTGTPKGAQRGQPDTLSPLAALFSKIPLHAPRDDDDRRAALPLLGLRPLHARPAADLDLCPAPQVRPRGDAEGDRRSTARRRSWSCR